MKAVVMAGGEGTRLRPLTSNQPKPMVPIVGKPCMEHILDLLRGTASTTSSSRSRSCRRRSAATSATARPTASRIRYSVEETPAGTAGSVKLAEEALDETFLVISGDALCDIDLGALVRFHKEKGARHDRPEERGQPARVRHRRHRRGGPHRALPREAVLGPGLHGHDQHGHLRGRARGAAPHPGGRAVRLLEGALPAPPRDGAAALRLRLRGLLAGHRQPRPVPPGELRRARRAGAARASPASAFAATSGWGRGWSSTTSRRWRARRSSGTTAGSRRAPRSGPYSVLVPSVDARRPRPHRPFGRRRLDVHRPQRGRRGRDRRPHVRHPPARAHPRGRRGRRQLHDRRGERRHARASGSTRSRRSSRAHTSTGTSSGSRALVVAAVGHGRHLRAGSTST